MDFLNRHFCKEYVQMGTKHVKRFLTSLVIKANHNHSETLLHTHYDDFNQKTIKCIGKDVKKSKPLFIVGGNVKWFRPLLKTVW